MKRFLVCTAVCLSLAVPYAVYGAPFLTCDPQATVEHYYVKGLAVEEVRAGIKDSGGAMWHDLATLPIGTYTVTARACKVDPEWGEVCSDDSAPFVFTRPSKSAAPVKMRLSK